MVMDMSNAYRSIQIGRPRAGKAVHAALPGFAIPRCGTHSTAYAHEVAEDTSAVTCEKCITALGLDEA